MATPFKTSPSKNGRLLLLSSDISEDLGLIDFCEPQFAFLDKDEFWLFEEDEDHISYKVAQELIDSCFEPKEDEYFSLTNSQETPIGKISRFDYLTKSVSRTATITRRKVENVQESTPASSKFGTITKRIIYTETPRVLSEANKINQTFDLSNKNVPLDSFTETLSSKNTPDSGKQVSISNLLSDRQPINVNSNTITKNRRNYMSQVTQNEDSYNNNIHMPDISVGSDPFLIQQPTNDDVGNDADLIPNQVVLNRTYEKYNSDNEETPENKQSRHYPTISRNTTRTILRREVSQGHLDRSNKLKLTQPQCISGTASNDDLLGSDTASNISRKSNLTMSSSVSGRSEPNLTQNFSRPSTIIQNKKIPISRILHNNKVDQLASKIARPSLHNESSVQQGMSRTRVAISCKLPGLNTNAIENLSYNSSNMVQITKIRNPNLWNNSQTHKSQRSNLGQKIQTNNGLSRK